MPVTIYGLKSCDSCRNARKWLQANGREHRFHDLRDDGLQIQMLERWAAVLGWEKLLNTRSATWRKIPENDRKELTRSSALALMLEYPTLVKRPVYECGETVAVGFTAKAYESMAAAG